MEPRRPRWDVHPALDAAEIARIQEALAGAHLSPLLVQLLHNRGLTDPAQIARFLTPPDISECPDPLLMVGMKQAVARISRAIDEGEKIMVYGDFDADGVTATALLTTALGHFGASVDAYLPHRVNEGYGLNIKALSEIAAQGARLVVTVDCGISNIAEAQEAQRLGLDLIVTDHHHLPKELPDVICINPKQKVDGCEDFEDLAGVGVAYQLVRALVRQRGKPRGLSNKDLLGLVAIGTVSDVAPLRGANRSLVYHGIAAISDHSLPGLRTLLDFAHVKIGKMDTERIGFVIGPRLNAAGRMDNARLAYELLVTEDERKARELAQKLEAQNRQRQGMMNSLTDQARRLVRAMDEAELIVLHSPNWLVDSGNPLGVVGLVAGKLADEFGRPALVLAPDREEGQARGSARSIPDFDIHEALTEVRELLIHFGGHSAAAGLTVRNEDIEELKQRLCEWARTRPERDGATGIAKEGGQVVMADAEIALSDISFDLQEQINTLAPFGAGNPYPLFLTRRAHVVEHVPLREGAHKKILVADDTSRGSEPLEAIIFRINEETEQVTRPGSRVDLLYHIERREWGGGVHLQLRVRDVRPSVARET